MPRASSAAALAGLEDGEAAHRTDPGRPDLLAQAVGPLLGLVLERLAAVELVHVRQHLARSLGVSALDECGRVRGVAQQQVGVEYDVAEVEAQSVLVRRDVAVRWPRLRRVQHAPHGGEQDREPVARLRRVVVRPEQVAESGPGHDPSPVRRQDLDQRPRLSRPPGGDRHLRALDRDRERSQDRDGDRPVGTVVADRAPVEDVNRRAAAGVRAASRARDRSVPSASGSRPISTSTRATAGPAPPADQIDRASVSASRARAGSSRTVASSSRASASRSAARTSRAAATARRACSAAAARWPRMAATRPVVVRAIGSRSCGAIRSASAAALLGLVRRFVGSEQGLTGQRGHEHLHVAGPAGQLRRLGVGGTALLLVPERPVDVARPDQAQGGPGRTQPAAEGDRALEVPQRLVELAGTGECLAQVVQRPPPGAREGRTAGPSGPPRGRRRTPGRSARRPADDGCAPRVRGSPS